MRNKPTLRFVEGYSSNAMIFFICNVTVERKSRINHDLGCFWNSLESRSSLSIFCFETIRNLHNLCRAQKVTMTNLSFGCKIKILDAFLLYKRKLRQKNESNCLWKYFQPLIPWPSLLSLTSSFSCVQCLICWAIFFHIN